MQTLSTARRAAFGAVVLALAVPAAAQARASAPALDALRARGLLQDAIPATAAAQGPLAWLAVKQRRSRFAAAVGSGGPLDGDIGIGVERARDENEPSVAANPRDERVLVAGSHSFDPATFINHCVAYASRDGGRRWSRPEAMRQLTPASTCSDPVLAYAPDGSRAYYAYMDLKFSESIVGDPEDPERVTLTSDFDIIVSWSDNGGRSWSRPVVALEGDPSSLTFDPETGELLDFEPGFDYDKPWIAAHVPTKAARNRQRVHVSATRFHTLNPGFACDIVVAGSADAGASWSGPTQLDTSGGDCGDPVLVQGSRPSGGVDDDVTVAWYHSGGDGPYQGAFEIRTAFSPNGRSWSGPMRAVRDRFEVPFWLGPFAFYHRWGGTMFPDVEIGADGRGHIAYTHDPAENGFTFVDPETGEEFFDPTVSTTAEDGDIRYITSRRPASGSWSSPVTLNDDRLVRAQGYAALETSPDGDVHVLWEDHRRSPERPADPDVFGVSSNLYFDMFATRRDDGRWSRNTRVTDRRSISDFIFIGDYNDITTSRDGLVFGIWTDRRHQRSTGAVLDPDGNVIIDESALEDNVFGAALQDD